MRPRINNRNKTGRSFFSGVQVVRKREGFTLIELLVVIAVIALLMAIL
ncbi:MAG: prepilin-type N-terminal cleavage/methylation domain-containing protein, partial [Phycisphaerales bacterium]